MRTYGRITTSNLLQYASFSSLNSDGSVAGWASYQSAQNIQQEAGPAVGGAPYYLYFEGNGGPNPRVYATVRPLIAAGQPFTVSAYILAPRGYTIYAGAKGYTAASNGSETSQYKFSTAPSTGGWQLLTASDVSQSAGPYISLWAGISGVTPQGTPIELSAPSITSGSTTVKQWVEVQTDPSGNNDLVYLTTLCQVLKLSLGESPFYANYGLPARQSVLQQVWPDYYVALVQQTFAPYFAMLSISKQTGTTTPTYTVIVITHSGVSLSAEVQVPT